MIAGVEPVAALRGQVDAADERHAIVDDDDFLVVAVQRTLVGVERALDVGAVTELRAHGADGAARRPEDGDGSPGPHEDTHIDPLGQLRQQVAQDEGRTISPECERRAKLPTRQPHV